MVSTYLLSSSTSCSGLRAVATTRSPALSTVSVNTRPRPRDAPVMSQTFDINPLSRGLSASSSRRDPELIRFPRPSLELRLGATPSTQLPITPSEPAHSDDVHI